MAGKSNTFENDIVKLIFNGVAIANIADNAASSPLTSLYVSLHTADPGEAGTQTTSEASYGGYARVAVARTTGGWTVTAGIGEVKPVSAITFPQATSGSNTITHFAIGTSLSGAGKVLYAGAVSPAITVTANITPQLTTDTTITED